MVVKSGPSDAKVEPIADESRRERDATPSEVLPTAFLRALPGLQCQCTTRLNIHVHVLYMNDGLERVKRDINI